ncbi:MAG: hypothetical protein H6739_19475 [Alphaproteobacteria bacterium]|nr:hypothetical protein [Alphaproteobacteria bacterium]
MSSNLVRTEDAAAALAAILRELAQAASGDNQQISQAEAEALHPFLRLADARVRIYGGAGTRVSVDNLVEAAVAMARTGWEAVNPVDGSRDSRYLAQLELWALRRHDPHLAELSWQAYRRVQEAQQASEPETPAEPASLRDWVEGTDFNEYALHQQSLPGGVRVDARRGQPGREGLPEAVVAAFDFYHRLEERDIGGASLHRGNLGGQDVWAIYTTTDGDEAWLELYDADGGLLEGARLYAGRLFAWDHFPGRSRVSDMFLTLAGYTWAEGYSEPDERARFGQPPSRWTGDANVDAGWLHHQDRRFLHLETTVALTDDLRALAEAAFERIWPIHLRHTVWNADPIELGFRRQGTLAVGDWTRSTDGLTYQTASWRDIDDGSFVLYFTRDEWGLRLVSAQFDN